MLFKRKIIILSLFIGWFFPFGTSLALETTLSKDLHLHIPALIYYSESGNSVYWADLKPDMSLTDKLLFEVENYGQVNLDSIAVWKKPGFKAEARRYFESNPSATWQMTMTTVGMISQGGKNYIEIDRYNYRNQDETKRLIFPENLFSELLSHPIDQPYYGFDDDGVTKCVDEGMEAVTVPAGVFYGHKKTCWGADYVQGLPLEQHTFPPNQKWIDWFHPMYLVIKEVDYWTDNPPKILEMTGFSVQP